MFISFIYGFCIYFGYKFTKELFVNNLFNNLILNLFFSFNIVVFYIIVVYKINGGIFHLYFLLMIVIGYFMSNIIVNVLKKVIFRK